MGWFWQDNNIVNTQHNTDIDNDNDTSMCPYLTDSNDNSKHPNIFTTDNNSSSTTLNPFNNMPNLTNEATTDQNLHLTKDRTISNIPMGTEPQKKWEYPSAQQMYNAMLRKGKVSNSDNLQNDTIESMVQIHNFLNESCWLEILRWEQKYTDLTGQSPKLLKFMGKPGILTPRARLHYYMSFVLPWVYERELPFDRHDWIVLRSKNVKKEDVTVALTENSNDLINQWDQVRYVLDFYSGPDDENGMPTFSVDVRPALDNLTNVKDRIDNLLKR